MSDFVVDVVMCTWNSYSPWFERCLHSIKSSIPIHCFILVDKESDDETVNLVKKNFPEAKVIRTSGKLAHARKIGIRMVDTEWFLFVDDDIEFGSRWFANIAKKKGKDVGAINGLAVPTDKGLERFFELRASSSLLRTRRKKASMQKQNDVRGLTGNTLIRTEAVKGWNPPDSLPAYEDHHLLRYVVQKGYKWITASDARVKHYGIFTFKSELKKAKWNSASARLIGAMTIRSLIRRAFLSIALSLFASVKIRNPRILILSVSMQTGYLVGYLKWSSFLESYPRLTQEK